MKNSVKALALAGLLMASSAFASELRSPQLSERGPLRYDFFKLPKGEDAWWFTMSNAGYMKSAHKAYMKHGTKTKPLTALIFNKSDFAFQDAFPGGDVPYDSENYSPFLKILKYSPRAEYCERGMVMGGKLEMPVWDKKGRVGIRFSLPFKKVEMERKDDTDLLQDPREQVTDSRYVSIDRNSAGMTAVEAKEVYDELSVSDDTKIGDGDKNHAGLAHYLDNIETDILDATVTDGFIDNLRDALLGHMLPSAINASSGSYLTAIGNSLNANRENLIAQGLRGLTNQALVNSIVNGLEVINRTSKASSKDAVEVTAYRADFVRNIINELQKSEVVGGNNSVQMFTKPAAATNEAPDGITAGVGVALVGSNSVGEPLMHAFMVVNDPAAPMNRSDLTIGTDSLKPIKTAGDQPSGSTLGYFSSANVDGKAVDYKKVLDDYEKQLHGCGCPTGDGDSKYWYIFRRQMDAGDENPGKFGRGVFEVSDVGKAIEQAIDDRLKVYDEHPLLFLKKAGVEFETDMRTGIGDLDAEIFYEHLFNDDATAKIFTGVRFPTASGHDSRKSGNPYRVHLGNGGHFEINLGAEGGWQPLDWMNFKAHARWSFVLESEETRMATFTGSCVKNVGPCVKADVDWNYFVGQIDFNFFHPESSDICGTMGYEFFYKSKDHVCYKVKSMESFAGKKYKTEAPAADGTIKRTLIDNPQTLGKSEAEKYTERIAHKIRGEASYRLSKYIDIFAGSSYVFAGQYVPAECEIHAGWSVRF